MFDTVAIIGPGLIGGSLGMGLRRRELAGEVVGIGRRRESLDQALQVGAVDTATLEPAEGVRDADLVVLATPIGAFGGLVAEVAEALKPQSILTDVASTKAKVIETVSSALRARPDVAYVPSHPMAGSEKRGPLAADPDLFEGAVCILTPLTNTQPESKSRMTRMWQRLGARVVSMSPQAHDRTVARVSHMPHLVAAAIVGALDREDMELCGRGLLDTTRIASGNPEIWLDICKTNREQIRHAVADLAALLERTVKALDAGDVGRLRSLLEQAKQKRDSLLERRAPPPHPEAQ
jgi:prephenate dehydrogenase